MFEIPGAEELTRFTVSAIAALQAEANTEYQALLGETTEENVTRDKLDRLKALRDFANDSQAEVDGRRARSAELAEFQAAPEETPAAEAEVTEETPAAVEESLTAAAPVVTTTTTTTPVVTVNLSDISGGVSNTSAADVLALPNYGAIVAAADVPGYATGQKLDGIDEMAKAFVARTNGYAAHRGASGVRMEHQVAMIRREYPKEYQVFGQSELDDTKTIEGIIDESKLPGGSLVAATKMRRDALTAAGMQSLTAAVAWCAPSTTIYDTCLQITTDGIADFPEVQATRGGIRHNQGIEFDGIFGDGTGFFNYTEAQIISGVTKPCLTIDCPPFVDERLGVTGLCLTGNILQNRAYPEYVSTFIRGALASSAHQINMLQIAAVVTGSTAVDLTAGSGAFLGDGSVVSQIYSAVEMAIVDIKYRLRLQRSASLEVKMPFWVLAQMRADWIRRNATSDPNLADAVINNWFATRGAVVDFVYDWQDAFSSAGVGPGADTPIKALPTQLVFLVYPSGTWVRAVSDVITLNSVYDSTKLASNQLTQLFTETGWKMLRMCTTSRAYTVNICPSGESGAQRVSAGTITC
jgi:hypothetical protein